MTRDDVRNAMHDYFDGFLSGEERDTIESYLEEYSDLANEYELLNKLIGKAQSLPIGIKIPNTVIAKISDELLTESLEKIEFNKQQRLRELTENTELEGAQRKRIKGIKKSNKPGSFTTETGAQIKKGFPKFPVLLFFMLFFIIGGYFLLDYFSTNLPWNVTAVYGDYKVGTIANKKSIDQNQTIITFDSTKVSLTIPGAGELDVRSYSTVNVVKGKEGDNIISLIAGRIDAKCKTSGADLLIHTKPAEIDVLAGYFTAQINNEGDLKVITGNGAVKLSGGGNDLILVRDYICEVRVGSGIGIPYHIDADSVLINLLQKISFGDRSISDFNAVLSIAKPLDGISLLCLLKEAKTPAERLPIFLKLNEFYPVVPGITQRGILKLDKEMMDTWRDDIEWQL